MSENDIKRGRAARWVLEQDLFVEAVAAVKEDCVNTFLQAPDEESVRQARHDVHCLNRILSKMGSWAVEGQREEDELKREEENRKK